ncbi:AMP-binding protein [Snuella sedimenti]|uniref:AMP-binding protein n=1 Tax=Snuella sedimenti TaxID=2798802 RepID=A0A8J7IIY1_9FLAO|nr:AMP-binding protein [Snuella sedimenti]MBJ6369166.1 AMP-binding protein [Snuella sedimenti]
MMYTYKNVHQGFRLDGKHYNLESLKTLAINYSKAKTDYLRKVGAFLLDWTDNNDYLEVKTSGSTGVPKPIRLSKEAMCNSALATGEFFDLRPGQKALHCLPTEFIAGKMMLVRALMLGLEIDVVQPEANPLAAVNTNYDFCAMTPFQVTASLENLDTIKTLIIGGAPVGTTLVKALMEKKVNAFETYGMTETITHIAAKPVNGPFADSCFKVLPNVSIAQDNRGCLVINAPRLSKVPIVTNDIVKVHTPTAFEWLGRYDNVINSGGIKLFPEQIEAKLQDKIKQRFFIASEPDENLGARVILVIEGKSPVNASQLFSGLSKYEIPKHVYTITKFAETPSGKVQRSKTLKLLIN